MVNLRFNKPLTKKLLHSTIREDMKVNFQSMDWGQENTDAIYGCIYWRPFIGGYAFFIIKEEDKYKLVAINRKGLIGIYLISDIEEFMDMIPIGKLEVVEFAPKKELLLGLGLTGYIQIENEALYVYDHVEI
jgi:hypothetical protein